MKRKDRIYVAMAAVCLVLGFVGRYFVLNQGAEYDGILAGQMQELSQLENKLEVKRVNRVNDENAVLSMVTGLDTDRKTEDDAVFTEFIKRVTTWSGKNEYYDMCREVEKEPVVKNAASFKSVFLNSSSYSVSTGRDVTCTFDSMESKVVSITGDKYVYFTDVNVLSSSDSGSTPVRFVCIYTMDTMHEMSDLYAYVLS